jgi:hypothetical protein
MFGLIFLAAEHLIPLFKVGDVDDRLARSMAISAIQAYKPETRADYINVARTIAFSATALALLAKTTSPDMTIAEQMRTCGRANALNRSADQSERTMMQRRRYQKAHSSAERAPNPEPLAPETEAAHAEMQAAIDAVMQEYLAARASASPPSPASVEAPDPAPAPLIANPTPPQAAIHYNGQPQTAPIRPGLLQSSAWPAKAPAGIPNSQPPDNRLPV